MFKKSFNLLNIVFFKLGQTIFFHWFSSFVFFRSFLNTFLFTKTMLFSSNQYLKINDIFKKIYSWKIPKKKIANCAQIHIPWLGPTDPQWKGSNFNFHINYEIYIIKNTMYINNEHKTIILSFFKKIKNILSK